MKYFFNITVLSFKKGMKFKKRAEYYTLIIAL